MSDLTWTNEQLEAINLRDKNILVSAAAGSGKTTLLTERLKRLVLEDGVSCNELLVLTFTRAAAAEMKQRFKKKLFDSLEAGETGVISENDILTQINSLTDAQISTIDSFAQTMVKRHFEILGIDPGFRIADTNEIDLLINETTDEVFESLFEENEENPNQETKDFVELINLFGGLLSNEGIKKLIKGLNRFFDTLADPDNWIEKFTKELEEVNETTLFTLTSLIPLYDNFQESLKRVKSFYENVELNYQKIPWSKTAKGKAVIENELELVEEILETSQFSTLIQKIVEFSKNTVYYPSGKKLTPDDKEVIEIVRKNRGKSDTGGYGELIKLQNQFKNINLEDEIRNLKELGRLFSNLVKLTKKINDEVAKKKKSNHILYFNDLERFLLSLLDNEDVLESIKKEYKYIYLDEVQDTNGIQEAIIQKIENGSNRFMVGDIKQSIYRFRSADPQILINKYHEYKKSNESELVLLNQNFRSSPEVINAINSIFEVIMNEEIGEIDYNDEAKLIATRTDHTRTPEIDIIINNNESFIDKDEVEARFIAQKIRSLVESGQAKYEDIGVLYRSIKKKSPTIIKVFAEEGIPVFYDGDSDEVDTIEISLFLKFLSLIDNHKQDIPLTAVLELPIFNFTPYDIAKIRTEFPDTPYFYQAVEAYKNLDDELAQRLKAFYLKLDYWRNQSKHLEMDEFLWQVLLESGFYNYFGNLNGGKTRKENLRLVIERAKSYKESSLKGITSFLQYVAKLENTGKSLTITGNTADTNNVVHLMSIHKSKGLEFKIVIYAGLNTQFNIKNDSYFYYSKDYGFGGKLPLFKNEVLTSTDTLLNQSLKQLHRKESLSEEMRLLYVAMTRAMDQLYLVGTIKSLDRKENIWKEETETNNLLKRSTPLDWIMSAIYNDPKLRRENETRFSTDNWNIRFISSGDIINENYSLELDEVVEDEDYFKLREQIFNQLNKPEKEYSNNKPLKMSVSRIKHHSIKEDEPIELIPLGSNSPKSKDFSPKDIGTATHVIMQRINQNELLNSEDIDETVHSQIKLLAQNGYLNKEIIPLIDQSIISEFFNSDLGQRYLSSYKQNADNILKEYPFLLDTNKEKELGLGISRPIELTGIIDLCFLEDDEWVLIDYKTDHKYNESQWKQRIDEYSIQVRLYEDALEQLTGLPVKEKHLVFLSEKQDILVQ